MKNVSSKPPSSSSSSRRTSIAAPCALTVGTIVVGGHGVVEVQARQVLAPAGVRARASCARG